MSSFADILRQEYKNKGLIPGLATSTGKKSLEILDIRNALFGGSRTGSLIGRKIFGKGYSATAARGEKSPTSVAASDNALSEIRDNSVISAKNSMALPIIANQINIMQKNIAKLVRIQGGNPSQRADSFFSSAKFRENAYESALSQGKKSPTQIIERGSKEGSGGLLTALALAGGALLFFSNQLGTTAKVIGGVLLGFVALKGVLMAISAMRGVGALLGLGNRKIAGKGSGRLAALLGVLGGGIAGYNLSKDDVGMTDEFGEPMNQGMTGFEGALLGAGAGLGVYGAKKLIQPKLDASTQKATGNLAFNEKAQRFTQNKRFVSAKDLPLSKTLEGLRNYYVRISGTPGLRSFVLKKLTAKFGIGVVMRLSAFLAGFAAAPFTAGLSTLISVASWGLTIYTLYEVYNWLFGEDNNSENMIREYEALQNKEQYQQDAQKEIDAKGPEQVAGPGIEVPGDGLQNLPMDRQSIAMRNRAANGSAYNPRRQSSSPTQVNDDAQVDQILATIRARESGGGNPAGNYSALNFAWNQGQTASGAYQITKPTWSMWTKKYGIGQEYEFAYQAPPEIQDEIARRAVKDILKQVGGDVSKVPNVWYTGNPEGRLSETALALNRGNTAEAYQKSWMAKYNELGGTQVASATPSMAAGRSARGSSVPSSSVALADARMAAQRSSPGGTTVNNTTNNNVAQSSGQGKPSSAYDPELTRTLLSLVTA